MNLLLIGICCIMVGIMDIAIGTTTFAFVIGGFCLGVGIMDVGIGLVKIMYGE